MAKRAHVFVSGEVQGVFFRQDCARRARGTGVAGFVRNLPDGRVEAAFEGEGQAVDDLVSWCHQGSDSADVRSVEVREEPPTGENGFSVSR